MVIVEDDAEMPSYYPPLSRSCPAALPTPGRSVAGIDGCKAGWVMVRRDAVGRFGAPVVVAALDDLPPADMVVIDIPIGLPESGRRACDLSARALLGRRSDDSVFTGARRPLLSRWGVTKRPMSGASGTAKG